MTEERDKFDGSVDRGRRGFLSSFAGELLGATQELRGIPQYRLDELGALPNEILRDLVLIRNSAGPCRCQGARIIRVARDGRDGATLQTLTPGQTRLMTYFDGERTAAQVASRWALETGASVELAFADVKSLVVALAKLMILVPATPLYEPNRPKDP